jgi:dihydrofolate synthase/folylpolyglutamate synthase
LTFFEALTALALYYFRKKQTDLVVLETGLGGRLDATNAVETVVCALTPISLEHTHILGDTIEKIAAEKAAIIKDPRQRVVIASQQPEAMGIFMERCRQLGISPLVVGEDIRVGLVGQDDTALRFNVETPGTRHENLKTGLLGRHQLENAAVALGIIEHLKDMGHPVPSPAIDDGLKQVRWPGRFEIVRNDPLVILDGAHNAASSQVLSDTVKELFPQRKVTMIVGFSQEKDINGMCAQFNRIADSVIATRSNHPRALHIGEQRLKGFFPGKKCLQAQNIHDAMRLAKDNLSENEIILVSGSLYLISEARALCTS